ncbi:MAG: MarR family transcriptional regulator [Proteobacteria bacterium]|nr:MarR family transcriptional regulator [Pseudomonadota bacterium]
MLREDLSRNFGFMVHDVARLLRQAFDRRMKTLGLTRSQWWVLTHLYRNDGVTQSELAQILEIDKPSLGRLLDRMEASGWVTREEDLQDRRAKRVLLTQEVGPAMKAMRAAAADLREEALTGISKSEQEQFVDTLLQLKLNLASLESRTPSDGSSFDKDKELVSK